MADAEASGCGMAGTEVLLWTFARSKTLYAGAWAPWPGDGGSAHFDAAFSTSESDGASVPTAGYVGHAYGRGGEQLAPGTLIEAFAEDVRCGMASLRRGGNFSGFILHTVGPDSVDGCDDGATLTFLIDGEPAAETAKNELGRDDGPEIVLTLK